MRRQPFAPLFLVSLLAGNLVALPGCAVGPAGPCDARGLEKVYDALAAVNREHRAALSAMGISEACTLAPAVKTALESVAMAPPEYRGMLALKGIADAGTAFEVACPGGTGMLAGAMALAPAERARLIVETCEPDFVASGESPEGDLLPIAILLRPEMEANDERVRRTVLRSLSGL
jgi:hypothetical protein